MIADRFRRFLGVGAIGFAVDAGVLLLLVHAFGVLPLVARIPSFLSAATVTWWLNRRWTFAAHDRRPSIGEWTLYLGSNGIGNAINLLVYAVLSTAVGLPPLASLAAASVAALTFNYHASARIVFRRRAPPEAPVRRVASFFPAVVTALAVAALSYSAMLGLDAGAMSIDREVIRQRVLQAYTDGDLLPEVAYSAGDRRRGVNQFNDCLILQSTLLSHGSMLADSVSPLIVPGKSPCEALLTLARTADPESLYSYHRYLFGARTVAMFALDRMSLGTLRSWGVGLIYGLLIACVISGCSLAWRRRASPDATRVGVAAAIVAGALALVSALDLFAPNLGHVYSDILVAGFLLATVAVPRCREHEPGFRLLVCAFGAWTAWFELMTGPFLAGFLVVGMMAFAGAGSFDEPPDPLRVASHLCAYVVAFLAVMGLQQIAAGLVTGSDTIHDFAVHLSIRLQLHRVFDVPVPALWQTPTNLDTYDLAAIFSAVRSAMPLLTYGSSAAALLLCAVAVALAAAALVRSRGGAGFGTVAGMGLLQLSVPLWYLAFGNHTVLHSLWMVRLVTYCWAASAVMFAMAISLPPRDIRRAALRAG